MSEKEPVVCYEQNSFLNEHGWEQVQGGREGGDASKPIRPTAWQERCRPPSQRASVSRKGKDESAKPGECAWNPDLSFTGQSLPLHSWQSPSCFWFPLTMNVPYTPNSSLWPKHNTCCMAYRALWQACPFLACLACPVDCIHARDKSGVWGPLSHNNPWISLC